MKKEILMGVIVLTLFIAGCSGKTVEKDVEKTPLESAVKETPVQAPEEVEAEQVEEVETASTTHTIKFVGTKFEPAELTVKAGDTVVWVNERDSPNLNKAMVVGTKSCVPVKSKLLEAGETFEYTFTEPMVCEIVDGYVTSVFGKVVVEE